MYFRNPAIPDKPIPPTPLRPQESVELSWSCIGGFPTLFRNFSDNLG